MRLRLLQRMLSLKKFQSANAAPTRMSFSILFDYPDAPNSYMKFRAVGHRGNLSIYSIVAPSISLSDYDVLANVKTETIEELVLHSAARTGEAKDDMALARNIAAEKISSYATSENKELLAELVAHDTVGYGPFSLLMEDSGNIEEIMVNEPTSSITIYHSTLGYCRTNLAFRGEREFRYMLNKMIEGTGKEVNSLTPIIDAQLPDGSRVHAQLEPYAVRGASASIRLSGSKRLGIRELLQNGTVSAEELAYLWLSIELGFNIIIAGAPSSGKTTLLSALCVFIPKHKRVISVEEDVNELKLGYYLPNNVALQGESSSGGVRIGEQVINALHMRPDILIVGEVRGQETKEVFFGANVGVPFATTMHSNTDKASLISRLTSKPMSVEPQSLHALDVAVMMGAEGLGRRKIEKIVEYKWVSKGEVDATDAGAEGYIAGEAFNNGVMLDFVRSSKILSKYANSAMIGKNLAIKELKKRAAFLNRLALQDPGSVDAAEYVRSYGVIS
ncbi:MAG: type II/IV secretion system ATPase subunit [Candidatus Micrarchaeaceae archaeon]